MTCIFLSWFVSTANQPAHWMTDEYSGTRLTDQYTTSKFGHKHTHTEFCTQPRYHNVITALHQHDN